MRRALFWLLASFLVWEGWVYLYSRPRFWAWLALAAEQTSHGARDLYNRTRTAQARRDADAVVHGAWQNPKLATEPLPDADNVIDAIRYFLREKRGGGA